MNLLKVFLALISCLFQVEPTDGTYWQMRWRYKSEIMGYVKITVLVIVAIIFCYLFTSLT